MTKLTKPQQVALRRLYERSADNAPSYLAFRRRAYLAAFLGCVIIPWCGMTIGIETDGYTHS